MSEGLFYCVLVLFTILDLKNVKLGIIGHFSSFEHVKTSKSIPSVEDPLMEPISFSKTCNELLQRYHMLV